MNEECGGEYREEIQNNEPAAVPDDIYSWYKMPDERDEALSRDTEPAAEINTRKKGSVMKTVMICVLALLLLIALVKMISESLGLGKDADEFSSGIETRIPFDEFGSDGDTFDDYPDFKDFFENYYVYSDDVGDIPRAENGTGVVLNLESSRALEELTLQEIYSKCSPSVVGISTVVDGTDYSWGSGIIMTEDGYIITNFHVISGTDGVYVILPDDSEYIASLVGYDSQSDIAVLKIQASGLPAASFGDASELVVGDEVVSIGNPLGEDFRGTMTNGIISAINRDVDYDGHTMTLMQTNAAINEGNSGGPLINMYGQVVGITNMKMMSSDSSIEGIGFAIPSGTMKTVVDALIEKGYVPGRPSIGIVGGSVPTEAASKYNLPYGVYVTSVTAGSGAEKAGLRVGDIIIACEGKTVYSVDDINTVKDTLQVGDDIHLTVFRDGDTFEVAVRLIDINELK